MIVSVAIFTTLGFTCSMAATVASRRMSLAAVAADAGNQPTRRIASPANALRQLALSFRIACIFRFSHGLSHSPPSPFKFFSNRVVEITLSSTHSRIPRTSWLDNVPANEQKQCQGDYPEHQLLRRLPRPQRRRG